MNDIQRPSKELVRQIRRTAEMSAGVMRDRERTGGWEGSERVARQFDRLAKLATELGTAHELGRIYTEKDVESIVAAALAAKAARTSNEPPALPRGPARIAAQIAHAMYHVLDDWAEENAQTGEVTVEIPADQWKELNRVMDLLGDDPHEALHDLIGVNDPDDDDDEYVVEAGHYANCGVYEGTQRGPCSCRQIYEQNRTAEPPAPVRQCHHAFDVLVITTAYESGFGHGHNLDALPNPYAEGGYEHHAYSIGYEEGERRRRANGSSGYCNQDKHERCANIDCMCKCHALTKESSP